MDYAIPIGMRVESADGQKIGKVVGKDRYGITITMGVLRRELRLRYEDVASVRDGYVHLRSSKRALIDAPEGGVAHP